MKNERDSLTRLNSSNPRTVLGVRIGAAPPNLSGLRYYPALCPVTAQKRRIVGENGVDRHDPECQAG
jgi:hypothetical protein